MTSLETARARGRELRSSLRRADHATLRLPSDRDPIALLEEQHRSRLPDLVPVRVGRMLQSPFTCYRGTAAVFAADLAAAPVTGVHVVSCGDAHLSNLGFYASPERRLMFDLNDFDEGGVGPWEWDVKRLAASLHLAGRDIGLGEASCRDAAVAAVRGYRMGLQKLMDRSAIDRYFIQADEDAVRRMGARAEDRALVRRAAKKARGRTSDQVMSRITTRTEHGALRIVDQPPIAQHVPHASIEELETLFAAYRRTVREDVAVLLGQFRVVDYVLRIVGVGSVGTRCYILLLEGPGGETLFLQAKEAQPSVLSTYGGMPAAIPGAPAETEHTEGHRVVAVQRILQAQSDPFLGWIKGFAGDERGRRVDYYWRQFRDMKGSIDPGALDATQLALYGQACGQLLARAHSQSPEAGVVAGYLGGSERFDAAVGRWAAAYADVAEADHVALAAAVRKGRLPALEGV
ncbi:MAG: DUF2252 domain-containing protein [Chloroflexi bacterium]|nr:DUF2252 domain-containing protein [Chloroflexota bacterium]